MDGMERVAQWAGWFARSAVTAWVGAAVLFVMVGVSEVTSPDFSSEVKDQLVVLRFPLFYATGFVLVGSGWLFTTLAPRSKTISGWRAWSITVLLTVALVGMVGDYFAIYLPLEDMVTPPGQPRTPEFQTLHQWSARINTFSLLLCMVAASLLNWQGAATTRVQQAAV